MTEQELLTEDDLPTDAQDVKTPEQDKALDAIDRLEALQANAYINLNQTLARIMEQYSEQVQTIFEFAREEYGIPLSPEAAEYKQAMEEATAKAKAAQESTDG